MIRKVYTSGQVGKICNVSPRTVSKWIDNDRLKGYELPYSHDRRVVHDDLITFMRDHGLPMPKEFA